MRSNEVLLVIAEEVHCSAWSENINGMDYSRQAVERFITQSNWNILSAHVSCWCAISVSAYTRTHIHTHTPCANNAMDFFFS